MSASQPQYFSATGKRKCAIAVVKLYQNGSGAVTVNGQKIRGYFFGSLVENATAPLKLTDTLKAFDVSVTTRGGGKSAQSDAVRHGISRALLLVNPELRVTLKRAGFLRRDARIKERKKPGLKRARRAPQFSKR
jgi:small subunit ribosomal protein S9